MCEHDPPSEFEGALDGVTDNGGTETGQESTGTLSSNDLSESTDHSLVVSARINQIGPGRPGQGCVEDQSTHLVVDLRLKLDTGLDDIDGREGTVGDGTTKSTGKGEPNNQHVLSAPKDLDVERKTTHLAYKSTPVGAGDAATLTASLASPALSSAFWRSS